jgi:nucleoside-diphosphate kinase
MAVERTLAIIKPDAVAQGVIGEAIRAAEASGLRPVVIRSMRLTKAQAEGFYQVHRDKPFFDELTTFMSEGPIVVMAFEGEGAIDRWRELMGATDPAKANDGTLRRRFGTDIQRNGFHGSDAPDTAAFELSYMLGGRILADAP